MNENHEFSLRTSESPSKPSFLHIPPVGWICALSSFILLAIYLLLALHVRLDLGRWPVPMVDNYQEPLFLLHFLLFAYWAYFAVLVAGPLWLLCLLIRQLRPASKRILKWQLLLLLGGWGCILLVYNFDPTTFTDWFLD